MAHQHYRKPHRYKIKKPLLRKRFLALGILILAIIGAIFYFSFFWKTLWVEKIIVSGEEKIAKDEIEFWVTKRLENRILFFATRSILLVDTDQIRKDVLSAFPGVADVKVKKSFFDAISVQVQERVASALWCQNENCFLVDGEGIIFEEASPSPDLIIIESEKASDEIFLGEAVIAKDKLAQILEIKSKLAELAKISIKKALLVPEDRLNLETSEGWEIYFNLKGDINWQVTELALVLEKQVSPQERRSLQYIDLRFSRVYYK